MSLGLRNRCGELGRWSAGGAGGGSSQGQGSGRPTRTLITQEKASRAQSTRRPLVSLALGSLLSSTRPHHLSHQNGDPTPHL